ncbi:MAG: SagB/ThcOx family dehydrogenase [Candidatus Omnitrophica bacterium]|nr:SagB/ThcOx family dehydrogenase [Candidatus Omnitrophota bacterium]
MKIKLPRPRIGGGMSLSENLNKRKSWRSFDSRALKLEDVSQILWSGGGKKVDAVTGATRVYPSAGATYPLELYLVVGENGVEGLAEGIYLYLWQEHSIEKILGSDVRKNLANACLGQSFIAEAPISVVVLAEYERTTAHYGKRGVQYVHLEAGNITQNLHLVAEELDLGTVIVGAFSDAVVKKVLEIPRNLEPLAIMPIGYKK